MHQCSESEQETVENDTQQHTCTNMVFIHVCTQYENAIRSKGISKGMLLNSYSIIQYNIVQKECGAATYTHIATLHCNSHPVQSSIRHNHNMHTGMVYWTDSTTCPPEHPANSDCV